MEDEFFFEEPVQSQNSLFKKISIIVLNILVLITGAFLIFSIYKISGIEDKLRYIGMVGIFVIDLFLVIITRIITKKPSKAKTIIMVILSLLFVSVQSFLGYFIYKTYSSLNNMNKSSITYTTVIATKKDSVIEGISDLKSKKIGIVNDETSIDGYIIGEEIINDHNLESSNKIEEYSNITEMVKDLYDKKIDAMIVSKNYPSMFRNIDTYSNIENETKIVFTKSKELTKEEVKKYTGDELTNFNTSDKIDKPFTLLLMGIDSTEKELSKNATGNGDSLMLVTFNPKTLNATILSIPRDTYVPIACFSGQKENKITHAAWNGESCMIKTIQNFTGINIDYYVKINFQGVVNLVNALDGIEVDVPIEFCESNSKRSTASSNLICLKKGKQVLNGEQALALARHRKTLNTGDLQRGVNQQIVVQGILNKIKTVRSTKQLLTVLDTISKSMDTNFTTKQILSFYDIGKKLLKTSSSSSNIINMNQLYLQGSSQMIYDEGMGLVLYDYIPNKESLKLIVSAMKQNLGLEKVKPVKRIDFSIEEPFSLEMIGADVTSGASTYSLLPDFVGQSESYARSWLSSNGISVNTETKEVNAGSGYFDGQVISQSLPANKRIDLISGGITLTVAKVVAQESNSSPTNNDNDNESSQTTTSCDTDNGYVLGDDGTCSCPSPKVEQNGVCKEEDTSEDGNTGE